VPVERARTLTPWRWRGECCADGKGADPSVWRGSVVPVEAAQTLTLALSLEGEGTGKGEGEGNGFGEEVRRFAETELRR